MDTNVFNEVEDPDQDFTFTFVPRADAWLRAGRARLSLSSQTEFVYFDKYAAERSIDPTVSGRLALDLRRLVPWVAGEYSSARQRLGFEIDLRSRRLTRATSAGLDVRVASKTRVGLSAGRASHRFDGDVFLGTSLRETLDRDREWARAYLGLALTVLTQFVVEAERYDDRFTRLSARHTRGVVARAGFDLASGALMSGRARVGARTFQSESGDLRRFRGVVADVGTDITLMGRLRLEFDGIRDIEYSFDPLTPYYVLTGGAVTVTPRLSRHWELQGRAGLHLLAYEPLASAPAAAGRLDQHTQFGAGVGYWIGRNLRIGINGHFDRRQSPNNRRDYETIRIGTSIAYGTP